ncbi:MAG: peptide chain release factor N(5)-glutamine methyltransferase [Rhizobiaceae bacterium]
MGEADAPAATLAALLTSARHRLLQAGLQEAALEARLLVEHFTQTDRTVALAHPERAVSRWEADAVAEALERRIAGVPVHRIIGHREFFGLTLTLSPETLDPRPDTEALVELVLPALKSRAAGGACHILDLGTGTGAIALALLRQLPNATALGTDIQSGALETAVANADLNGLGRRFRTMVSDWFADVDGRFHAIVSNPPYIASKEIETLSREVREHDPIQALDGGADGLDAYRIIAEQAGSYLEAGGVVAVEIGYDQREAVKALFEAHGFAVAGQGSDLGGHDRAMLFSPNGFQAPAAKRTWQ